MAYTPSTLGQFNHGVKTWPKFLYDEFVKVQTETHSLDVAVAAAAGGAGSVLLSTKFIVGNGSNVATAVNMSGDATLANTGAVTVASAIKNKHVFLTQGMGTRTALVTSGVDIAAGTTPVYYGVFFAPVDITALTLEIMVNEVYAKNVTDAIVALKDGSGSPVTIFTQTMTAGGVAAGTKISVSPQAGAAAITAGTRLDLYITGTGASGTGYIDAILRYAVT